MNEQFTNVRFESVSHKKMVSEIKHDLRMNKITSVVRPDIESNVFVMNEQGSLERFDFLMKSPDAKRLGNSIIAKLDNIEDRHRKLLRKNYNQSLNKKRVNSFNMGVLTFSDSMIELAENNLEEVLEKGVATIKEICEELKIELHYISFHRDEKGIPHFHYFTDNFNSQGKTISPKKNKNLGQRLQDLGNKFFNGLGFERGISKELTGKKHLTIKEYQDYKETKEMQGEMLENIFDLVNDFYEMGMNYKGKSAEELLKMFQRYFQDENKFEALFDKVINLANKQGLFKDFKDFKRVKASDLRTKVETLKTISKNKGNTIK